MVRFRFIAPPCRYCVAVMPWSWGYIVPSSVLVDTVCMCVLYVMCVCSWSHVLLCVVVCMRRTASYAEKPPQLKSALKTKTTPIHPAFSLHAHPFVTNTCYRFGDPCTQQFHFGQACGFTKWKMSKCGRNQQVSKVCKLLRNDQKVDSTASTARN